MRSAELHLICKYCSGFADVIHVIENYPIYFVSVSPQKYIYVSVITKLSLNSASNFIVLTLLLLLNLSDKLKSIQPILNCRCPRHGNNIRAPVTSTLDYQDKIHLSICLVYCKT